MTVTELDGTLVAVSVYDDVIRTCALDGSGCSERPMDVDAARPESEWDEDDEEWDEDEEWDSSDIAGRFVLADLDGRPVIVTGGGRFDLVIPGNWDEMGGGVRVWDPRTGRMLGKTLTGHELGVTSLTTVPSERGTLIVSDSEEGTLLVWELATGERVLKREVSYNGDMGAGVVRGRPVAVTGGHDTFVQVWDLLDDKRIAQFGELKPVVRGMAVTDLDGRSVVVTAGDDKAIRLWDLETQQQIGSPLVGHTDRIMRLETIRVDGRVVAVSEGYDGEGVRTWDLARGEQLGSPLPGRLESVTEVAGTPVAVTFESGHIERPVDGGVEVSFDPDRQALCVWDLRDIAG